MGYIGGITHLLTFDPNFLGHPSIEICVVLSQVEKVLLITPLKTKECPLKSQWLEDDGRCIPY